MNIRIFARLTLLYWILSCSIITSAQEPSNFRIRNSTIISNNNQLPLWFHANQHGKVQATNQYLNISEIFISNSATERKVNIISWNWGGEVIYAFGNDNYLQINQAYTGISFNGWALKGGLFYDPVLYAGLSSTNGNLVRSGNARPHPNLRFYNNNYKPLAFIAEWLYFKFEFDEGLLEDDRYVENTHLHHKSLYLLIKSKKSWDAAFGIEHYVMWGGTSQDPKIGRFPISFGQYLRYIFSIPGGSNNSQEHDKGNVSGNHVSTYQLAYSKYLDKLDISFYLSHPFENHPGLTWKNWPDNLIGVHVSVKNKTKLINDFVYEVINTRHQNLKNDFVTNEGDEEWMHDLYEDYFVHLLYKSGFTYHHNSMGSPLFFPVVQRTDEISNTWFSLQSNRFFAHHVGISGHLSEAIKWKGLLTYIEHLGTIPNPYEFKHKQLSGLLDIQYINNKFPVQVSFSIAFDSGNSVNSNLGVQLSVTKEW
ncbi:hypothetical protein OU798_23060 [Prolixibacteraceae bacterium Z1-6]|uniref:Capsule assembly protein Wzi n=1 Tax=Draconibacterium aestuarii TaxID=2998507 RepID=A0A9X3FID3_9BACT|nr:hypothetical protein [Prolixibacteraceae bacterium Z1-6]